MFLTGRPSKTFYAYLWLREDGTPYYVGKGSGDRAYRHCKPPYPPKDKNRILILARPSEQAAIDTEIELIRNWGRKDLGTGCLRNRTNGGDGISGFVSTKPKTEKAMKAALENIKKATAAIKGKKKSVEHKQKIQQAHIGKTFSLEHRDHIRLAKSGKPLPALRGEKNPRWHKPPTNQDALRRLNASRPRDARGRFFNDNI